MQYCRVPVVTVAPVGGHPQRMPTMKKYCGAQLPVLYFWHQPFCSVQVSVG
jgi:hypothetical protein